MNKVSIIAMLILAISIFSCQNKSDHTNKKLSSHKKVRWNYIGSNSPEHWAEISPDFIKCAEGHFQSPIDIESYSSYEEKSGNLQFHYHPSMIDELNNGHTIQCDLEEDNIIIANGNEYHLKQFHFHEPSEHHLDGIIFPMEVHLVHADTNGKLAVVGVFIKEGKENEYLKQVWDNMPKQVDMHMHPKEPCDLPHLLPENKSVFHYSGSLTTPPCTEGVEWFVMKEPISLSKAQIKKFGELYYGNNRPIQVQSDTEIATLEQ